MKYISVIIPVFNAGRTIGKVLEILSKNPNIEIIVINDGSTDNSLEVIKQHSKSNNNIHIFSQKNKGVSSARNAGLKAVNTPYVVFIDADDEFSENLIPKLYMSIRNNDFVMAEQNVRRKLEVTQKEILKLIRDNTTFYRPHSKIYRTEIIKNNCIVFDEEMPLGEDLLFNVTYLQHAKSALFITDQLYTYKKGGTSSKLSKSLSLRKKLFDKLTRLFSSDISFREKNILLAIKARWVLSVMKQKVL